MKPIEAYDDSEQRILDRLEYRSMWFSTLQTMLVLVALAVLALIYSGKL